MEYNVVSSPEFLREGTAVQDCLHPDRIVVGVESQEEEIAEQMRNIYHPVLEGDLACPVHTTCPSRTSVPFLVTDSHSAELIKHASNSLLAMKISLINRIADLCEAAGADVEQVSRGVGLDPRIEPAFLKPSIGFGGFCFPKDLQAFVRIGQKFGCDFTLLREVEKINRARIDSLIEKIKNELWALREKNSAVWGLAFKADRDNIRFAPSLEIIRRLLAEGAHIQADDAHATAKAQKEMPQVSYCVDTYEAALHTDAILILTAWGEFREVDWSLLLSMVERPLVIDGRNALSPDLIASHGFQYVAIGRRPSAVPTVPSSIGVPTAATNTAEAR